MSPASACLVCALALAGAGACTGAIPDPAVPPAGEASGPVPAPTSPVGAPDPGAPPPAPAPPPAAPPPAGAGAAAADGSRLVRLTPTQWANTIAALYAGGPGVDRANIRPIAGLLVPLGTPPAAGRFSTAAAALVSVSEFEVQRSLSVTHEVARGLIAALRRKEGGCFGRDAAQRPADACVRALLQERGALLFRRPLTDPELAKYLGLFADNVAALGADEALVLPIKALLLAPQFLFLPEIGERAAGGRVRLGGHELAAALSYRLTDFPPDAELWRAASRGELATGAQVEAQVRRLVRTMTAAPFVRFVREHFQYGRVTEVFEEGGVNRGALRSETDALVTDVLAKNGHADFLATLLTTTRGFASYDTAPLFGLPRPNLYSPVPVALPPGERAGILTQPAFLIGFSEATANHPVKRGRFISESLLCRPVPALPIGDIPPLPPPGPDFSLRDRLTRHSEDPGCAACHRPMDPLGLAFEMFDHVGRARTKEGNRPVDPSGALTGSGDRDGPFANALELAQRLAGSATVRACFLRHALRYWLGRDEQPADEPVLAAMDAAYVRGGGDLGEALVALFTSAAFMERTVP